MFKICMDGLSGLCCVVCLLCLLCLVCLFDWLPVYCAAPQPLAAPAEGTPLQFDPDRSAHPACPLLGNASVPALQSMDIKQVADACVAEHRTCSRREFLIAPDW